MFHFIFILIIAACYSLTIETPVSGDNCMLSHFPQFETVCHNFTVGEESLGSKGEGGRQGESYG